MSPDLGAEALLVLASADRLPAAPGPRDRYIREHLGMRPTWYFQLLNALLDDPRALPYAPIAVNRLRRVRDVRRTVREHPQP
ncbi:DUF3263 domain-containing protein [Streptomyces sp. cg36]|uniref:DUF3263 domain-containing protein n=1 Tax=Streptomyces sp. cg36 TaxID=3238798 RepID=UPI0034E2DA85